MKTPCIRSLALNNVIIMSSACYDFVSAVTNSPSHHLSMSLVANCELGSWSGTKSLNGSLSSLLPTSNTNLRSLVLRSPRGLYHSLSTQLRVSSYPALDTLVLENIVFNPTPSPDDIEGFVVRHGASLRRLELHSCSSYVPDLSVPVRQWATIWRRFRGELVSLEEIVVDDVRQKYASLDGASGYVPHPTVLTELGQEDEVTGFLASDAHTRQRRRSGVSRHRPCKPPFGRRPAFSVLTLA